MCVAKLIARFLLALTKIYLLGVTFSFKLLSIDFPGWCLLEGGWGEGWGQLPYKKDGMLVVPFRESIKKKKS